ncbi:MAG: serine hydrolase [Chitinophagaceae bacterium]|nr:serine hydrolase [Chitinophagaceae bacterium]
MNRFILFSFLVIISTLKAFSQNGDIVQTEGITSKLHRENVGRIFFSSKQIPTVALKPTDFLQTYQLTNKSDLFFIAYFGNSITNYLHKLAPNLSADSLVKIGNYQFTLYVDDKLIYQSNLLPGAPRAQVQDTATSINKPLIDNKNSYGIWSESFWNRFLRSGGDTVLTEGKHTIKMEIRPYINNKVIIIGNLIASGTLNLIVKRKPVINIQQIRLTSIKPYNGFDVSKENFDRNKIKELKGNIEAGVFKKISSIVVIRNGKILIEEYFNGASRSTLHDPRSVGKSFASTIAGIAIDKKHLGGTNQQLSEFYTLSNFKNYSEAKSTVSLGDLLTMSSAFSGNDDDGNSPGNEENMYPTEDWVKFALDLPTRFDTSKKQWRYFTAGVVLLGDILNKSVPDGLEKFAHANLFKPLGITNYRWQYTPQKVPNTAGGIQMNALDFAKYGQLYKNGGAWKGQQILSKNWVEASLEKQIQIPGRENEFYGYLFWNKSFRINNSSYEAFYCAGNGGNYILIFKDQPLVIVITATAYGQSYAHPQVTRIIEEFVLLAVLR